MSRAWYAGCFIGYVVLLAAGCRMCAHPYDYCGPVVDDPQACCPNARAGSILASGGGYGAEAGTLTPTQGTKGSQPTKAPTRALSPPKPAAARMPRSMPTPAPAPANTAPPDQSASKFFPGIPRENILSVTDRRLDEVEESKDASVAEEEPAQPASKMQLVRTSPAKSQTPAKPSSPVKQTGWTARNNALSVE